VMSLSQIISRRSFERKQPVREATKVFIFSEGKRREYDYFNYFVELDSRINVIVNQLEGEEDNSPTGLYQMACDSLCGEEPEYEVLEGDQIWIVCDTDTWGDKIVEVRTALKNKKDWYMAQSNLCFEVWLYYHFLSDFPDMERAEQIGWKQYVNEVIPGGFNSTKHPSLLPKATANAKLHFRADVSGCSMPGSTEVYLLGEVLLSYIGESLPGE